LIQEVELNYQVEIQIITFMLKFDSEKG